MQGFAWRMAPTRRIQPLDPELVSHRGRFPRNKVSLSVKDLDSAILLLQYPSSLKIESAKWEEDKIERLERRIDTMGDLFEATKQEQFLSLGSPSLDVCTLKGKYRLLSMIRMIPLVMILKATLAKGSTLPYVAYRTAPVLLRANLG